MNTPRLTSQISELRFKSEKNYKKAVEHFSQIPGQIISTSCIGGNLWTLKIKRASYANQDTLPHGQDGSGDTKGVEGTEPQLSIS